MHPKYAEFLEKTESLSSSSSPDHKQAIFEFIAAAWEELGEEPKVKEDVCAKLKISEELFGLFVSRPWAVKGMENMHTVLGHGWLKDYLTYTIGQDSPEEFHLWTAFTILGASLRRSAWIDMEVFKIYPNFYTILVAPPGMCRKTTGTDMGIEILKEGSDCKVFAEKITPEAIAKGIGADIIKTGGIETVSKPSHGLFYAPELGLFLGGEQYNSSTIIILTRLYDCPNNTGVETIKRGFTPIRDAFVSLLGCTTHSELPKIMPESAAEGGFLSRITILSKHTTPRIYPKPLKLNPTLRESLVVGMRSMKADRSGPYLLSKEANDDWYEPYYAEWKFRLERTGGALHLVREPQTILKIAMLLNISEGLGYEISKETTLRAKDILTSVYASNRDLMEGVSQNKSGDIQRRIFNLLKRHGGVVSRAVLTRAMYGKVRSLKEVDEALSFLDAAGLVKTFVREIGGKTNTFYRLGSIREEDFI